MTTLLEDPEFFQSRVWPLIARGEPAARPPAWEVAVAQQTGTGRVTLEYRLASGLRVFAKGYPDGAAGFAAHQILCTLWEQGFGPESPYRVPEPLGYLPEQRVLLMDAAPGESVRALEGRGQEVWQEGLRGAARWLAALHASPIRTGPAEDGRQSLLRLSRYLVQAAALQPEAEGLLVRFVRDLADRAAATAGSRPQVQTHARYHSDHVFLAPGSVTAIDLDRSGPGDPALDVAEFLHRLRAEARKGRLAEELVQGATALFLREYAGRSPADLSGLLYYWSRLALTTLVRAMHKTRLDRETRERHLEFHRAEFYDIPRCLEVLAPRIPSSSLGGAA